GFARAGDHGIAASTNSPSEGTANTAGNARVVFAGLGTRLLAACDVRTRAVARRSRNGSAGGCEAQSDGGPSETAGGPRTARAVYSALLHAAAHRSASGCSRHHQPGGRDRAPG